MAEEKQKPVVKLIGGDGNAFSVLGACLRVLRQAGYSQAEQVRFMKEATSGDYNQVLATAMKWLEVE
jgi:hypothetical protein